MKLGRILLGRKRKPYPPITSSWKDNFLCFNSPSARLMFGIFLKGWVNDTEAYAKYKGLLRKPRGKKPHGHIVRFRKLLQELFILQSTKGLIIPSKKRYRIDIGNLIVILYLHSRIVRHSGGLYNSSDRKYIQKSYIDPDVQKLARKQKIGFFKQFEKDEAYMNAFFSYMIDEEIRKFLVSLYDEEKGVLCFVENVLQLFVTLSVYQIDKSLSKIINEKDEIPDDFQKARSELLDSIINTWNPAKNCLEMKLLILSHILAKHAKFYRTLPFTYSETTNIDMIIDKLKTI